MRITLLAASAAAALFVTPAFAIDAGTSGAAGAGASTTGGTTTGGAAGTAGGSLHTPGADASASGSASGSLTVDNVSPTDPFGDLEVDTTAAFSADGFSVEQLAELKQRCDLIASNKDRFDAAVATWCETHASSMN